MANYIDKCTVLAELWINYRDDKDFKDFLDYNDLGLPMAYMLAEGLVSEVTEIGQNYINESYNLFIKALDIEEDEIPEGTNLVDLLDMAYKRQNKDK
jgi:hypothetical protein